MFGFIRSIFYDIESLITFYINQINIGEGKIQNKNSSKWINDKSKIVNDLMSWYMIDYSRSYKKFFNSVTKFLNESEKLDTCVVYFLVNIFTENPYLISYNHGDPNKEWNFIRRLTMLYFSVNKKSKLKEIDLHNKQEISEKHPDLLEITILENKKHIIFVLLQKIIQIQYRFELLTNNVSSLFSSIGSYGDLTTPMDGEYSFYICLTRKDNSPFYLWFHRFVPKFDYSKAKATNIIYDCKLVSITEDIPPDLLKRITKNDLSRMQVLVQNIQNSKIIDDLEQKNQYQRTTSSQSNESFFHSAASGNDSGDETGDESSDDGESINDSSNRLSQATTIDNQNHNRDLVHTLLTSRTEYTSLDTNINENVKLRGGDDM